MLHKFFGPGDWFAPKKYGYGAGLPIAWQGWVVMVAYMLVVLGAMLAIGTGDSVAIVASTAVVIGATVVLILITRKRTRGGWKWRSGEE